MYSCAYIFMYLHLCAYIHIQIYSYVDALYRGDFSSRVNFGFVHTLHIYNIHITYMTYITYNIYIYIYIYTLYIKSLSLSLAIWIYINVFAYIYPYIYMFVCTYIHMHDTRYNSTLSSCVNLWLCVYSKFTLMYSTCTFNIYIHIYVSALYRHCPYICI